MVVKKARVSDLDVLTVGGEIAAHPPCYSADSKYLISACGNNINVYSTITGDTVSKLFGHEDEIVSFFINPFNNLQLYTISRDYTIRLWDYEEGQELLCAKTDKRIKSAVPSPNEEGVIYAVYAHAAGKNNIYEVYLGLSPRNASESDPLENLGKESVFVNLKTSHEVGKCALLGTGIIDANGEEILATSRLSGDALERKVKQKRISMEFYPAKIQKYNGVTIYVEENFFIPAFAKIKGILVNNQFLFYFTKTSMIAYDYKQKKEGPKCPIEGRFSCAVAHPTEDLIACGMKSGAIQLWRYSVPFNQQIRESFRWHSDACLAIQFSLDGTFLLTGGYECVLVLWQLHSGRKQFLPGLGTAINGIAVSPNSRLYSVSTAGNCIHLINTSSLKIHKTITSIVHVRNPHRVYVNPIDEVKEAPIVVDPRTGNFVAEGAPGVLQFYNPVSDKHVQSLVVAKNYLDDHASCIASISHICFVYNGDWLVTVDTRSFNKYGREAEGQIVSLIKFWRFSDITQNFELATQVNAPHDQVTSLSSCPTTGKLVTTGSEGKFAIWEKIFLPDDGENHINESWRCRSVGYYRSECASASAFSTDGSLLAISYGTIITLWDPVTIVLKRTLKFSHSSYDLKHLYFISNAPFLLTASKTHLYVWNLLNLQLHWFSEFTLVHSVAVDPILPRFSVLMNNLPFTKSIFLPRSEPFQLPPKFANGLDTNPIPNQQISSSNNNNQKKKKKKPPTIPINAPPTICYLFQFNVGSYEPSSVTKFKVVPRSAISFLRSGGANKKSTVGFLSGHSLMLVGDKTYTAECRNKSISQQNGENPKKALFSEIFGELKDAAAIAVDEGEKSSLSIDSKNLEMLDAPSHLIPSVNILFSTWMDSKLIKAEPTATAYSKKLSEEQAEEMEVDAVAPTKNKVLESAEIFDGFDMTANAEYVALCKSVGLVTLSN